MDDGEISGKGTCIIVIPCYNEGQRLQLSLFRAFIPNHPHIHFLFVDDGSTDDTSATLEALRSSCPEAVEVLNQPRNQGKAEAVRVGMKWAIEQPGAAYTGFWDADLATPLNEIPRLLALFGKTPGIEIVLGSRVKLLGRFIYRRPMRHFSGRIFATLASLTLSLPVYDTQCGAKLFRVTPTFHRLLDTPFFSRWIFDVELLARFLNAPGNEHGEALGKIYEEPLVTWEDVGGSKLNPMDSWKALGELFRIKRRYFMS